MALTIAPQLLANLSLAQVHPSSSNVPQALKGPGLNSYLVRSDSGGTWTMLRDGLGSIAAVTTGSSTRSYAYSPFGASVGSGASSSNPYQFTGNQLDASGLYSMNARYYSPVLQQFVSADPLGVAAGNPDVYAYANNSPTNMIDPVGLFCDNNQVNLAIGRFGGSAQGNVSGSGNNSDNSGSATPTPAPTNNLNNIESRVRPLFALGPSISSPTVSPVVAISQPIPAQEMHGY